MQWFSQRYGLFALAAALAVVSGESVWFAAASVFFAFIATGYQPKQPNQVVVYEPVDDDDTSFLG